MNLWSLLVYGVIQFYCLTKWILPFLRLRLYYHTYRKHSLKATVLEQCMCNSDHASGNSCMSNLQDNCHWPKSSLPKWSNICYGTDHINSPVDFFSWQVVRIFRLLHYHHFQLPILHPAVQRAEQLRQMHPPHRHFQYLYELCNLGLLQSHLLFWQLSLLPLWNKKIQHVKNVQFRIILLQLVCRVIHKMVSSLHYLIPEVIPKQKYHLCSSQRLQSYRRLQQRILTCTC